MLLRYLSHQSIFSPLRPAIPSDALLHIGLYWRADTQFSNAMNRRKIDPDVWEGAFNHMTALILGLEVLKSLVSISCSTSTALMPKDLTELQFPRLRAFDQSLPSAFEELMARLQEMLWTLEAWVSDVRKHEQPAFLPGRKFILALIGEVAAACPRLSDAVFFVYMDEYENLSPYQQELVNTWLKHSETPLIFNLAIKRNGLETKRTVGPESLSDIHDYRTFDLEADFLEEDFPTMAAEILFLQAHLVGVKGPIDPNQLRDPSRLPERRNANYVKNLLSAARNFLPELSHDDLARGVFQDPALRKKLHDRIVRALGSRGSALSPDLFMRERIPQASIVAPALLSRSTISEKEILTEIDKCERDEDNNFTGTRNWVHNNFIGCLLNLYEPHSRACPFYAGFETFCQLSRGNLRHFLELCHKSVTQAASVNIGFGSPVPPTVQAEAARQASTAFLREVRTFGSRGTQLHAFVLWLGSLFALAHQRPSQSESEQSHFSIGSGTASLNDDDYVFLSEAVKWSVLFESKATKQKSDYEPENIDYVLNPIYAPFFNISFRKKRKLELKTDEVICLIRGSYSDVRDLLRRFSKGWDVEPQQISPSLFSHLQDQNEK